MEILDITPYVIPERVLKFDFSTNMLFRCIDNKYAKTFIKGEIRFSQPKFWIEEEEKGNKGQGDKLEGTFFSAKVDDDSKFLKDLKSDKRLDNFNYDGYTFFRKKGIEQLYCLCFYGLHTNSFCEKTIDKKGKAHYISRVKKEYFENFSKKVSKADYLKKAEGDRPTVVFIKNPNELFNRIRRFFNKFGIRDEEIIISPVQYTEKRKISMSLLDYPKELLLKDRCFEEQSEVRIIVNSNNKEYLDYMEKNNNIISVGNIEDIAEIYDYYFEDLVIEKKSKNSIEFNLPHEEVEKFEEMTLEKLIALFMQASQNDLPESLIKQKEELIIRIKDTLKKRFNIDIEYVDGNINIYNADESIFKELNDYNRPFLKRNNYDTEIKNLINKKKYIEAYEKITTVSNDPSLMELGYFYMGKIMEEQEKYLEAIPKYEYCIKNEINLIDALSSRSNCYSRLGKYDLALEDLERLQELIGYNHQIYTSKGVNYIYLNNLTQAIEEFNKSINMIENNPDAYYNRSVAYYRLNKYKDAKNDIEKALLYNPTNVIYKKAYEDFYNKQ